MTINVRLPDDRKEAAFVIQLLNKLNLVIERPPFFDGIDDELKQLLNTRIADAQAYPDDEMTLAAFEKFYY